MNKFTFLLTLLLTSTLFYSQTKNFIDQPYIETSARADTLVSPDRIYLNILITEKDSKGKISVEELESKMISRLNSLRIDTKKNLLLKDLASNYRKYFLKQQDIQKAKSYSLVVTTGELAGKVILSLEEIEISNISVEKTEYSKNEQLMLILKSKAVKKAKNQAVALTLPLNQKIQNAILISDLSNNVVSMLSGRVSGIGVGASSSFRDRETFEPADIEFEKIKFEAIVNVTFKLE